MADIKEHTVSTRYSLVIYVIMRPVLQTEQSSFATIYTSTISQFVLTKVALGFFKSRL